MATRSKKSTKNRKASKKKQAKMKIGLYVDDSNMYYAQRDAGWKVDYKKLLKYFEGFGKIEVAKYFMGMPAWQPAKDINNVLKRYFSSLGYVVITKPLKRIKDNSDPKGFRNKCNFDVEIAMEIDSDIDKVDKVIIASGDSDFIPIKNMVLKLGKKIEYYAFKNGCAWEIRVSNHTFFDDIKTMVEKV